jgi:Porin subfamily
MTLIKSMLLGSAAAIVAAAGAQAADLPTRKAAPVEYVQVCNVGGIVGWVLPDSDTCMKISGYISAQFVGGNLTTQYNYGTPAEAAFAARNLPSTAGFVPGLTTIAGFDNRATQRVLLAASSAQQNTNFYRNNTGWTVRGEVDLDFASNTAYGPLLGHFNVRGEVGNGLDPLQFNNTVNGNVDNLFYVSQAYLSWAGITAGKAASFFSFIGGGDNFANIFSPDRKGFNEPILMAYTASFGGGFSATISAESPGTVGASGIGTQLNGSYFNTNSGPQVSSFLNGGNGQFGFNPTNITYGGQRWPDVVGNIHVTQGWGEAQVSGVVHDVNVSANGFNGDAFGANPFTCGLLGNLACNGQETKTGWAVDAGVKVNLQNWWGGVFSPGDDLVVTGAYSQSAVWYSGLWDGMWNEAGAVNGNGQPMWLADAFFNPATNQWSTPYAWSATALLEHHWTPQFYTDFEGSIGGIRWNNMGGGCNFALGLAGCLLAQGIQGPMSPHAFSWIIGADVGWNPVTNLNFDLELMYQSTDQTRPSGFLGTVYNWGVVNPNGTSAATFVPGDWRGVSSGFAGRLRITRYF